MEGLGTTPGSNDSGAFRNIDSQPLGNLLRVKQMRGGGIKPKKLRARLKMPSLRKGIGKTSDL